MSINLNLLQHFFNGLTVSVLKLKHLPHNDTTTNQNATDIQEHCA